MGRGERSGTDRDLAMTQEAEIFRTAGSVIDQKGLLLRCMRIMAAGTSQFLSLAGGVKMSHDRMIVAEPVASEDVLPVGLVGMAVLADHSDLLGQEPGRVRCMGIMAGQAIAARKGKMDILLRELGLVVARKTEVRNRCREGKDRFLLCVGIGVAGSAAMFHAGILRKRGMDDPLRYDLLVAIDARLFRGPGSSGKSEGNAEKKGSGEDRPEKHGSLYTPGRNKSTGNTKNQTNINGFLIDILSGQVYYDRYGGTDVA